MGSGADRCQQAVAGYFLKARNIPCDTSPERLRYLQLLSSLP